jgi:phosphatidylinositol alpha-1,6-mannosyltransferase
MNILFVSRAYPPITGGIENQNYGLATTLVKKTSVTIIANPGGKKTLWWFLPYAFLRLLVTFWRYDVVLFGDGVLVPLGLPLTLLSRRIRIASVIHGLDVTFFRKQGLLSTIYRFINIPALRRAHLLIAVGTQTREEALSVGVLPERCVVIPNGVFVDDLFETHSREELARVIDRDIRGKKIVLRIGRYVKHKGVEWFIRNVVPHLPDDTLFVAAGAIVGDQTAGDSNAYPRCVAAVHELGLEDRVVLLANLPWGDMKILFNTIDLVVSPNIPVIGTMEGFGINIIEASSCARVVIASRLEGLRDAIVEGKNGFFVEPLDAKGFVHTITDLLSRDDFRQTFGLQAREFSREHFRWETITDRYLAALEHILPSRHAS